MSADTHMVAHHFEDAEQQRGAALLGMWLFLATEILFFGALFTAYAVYRQAHPEAFASASGYLRVPIAASNTVILITSSLTMALAVHAAQLGGQRSLIAWLRLTILLGSAFLGLKGYEYYLEYEERLIPAWGFNDALWDRAGVTASGAELFFLFYFVMTGLHAIHMVIGIGVLSVLSWQAGRARFSRDYYTPVELAGLYWHFVDIVWIFLFPVLYLVGTRLQH